MDNIKEQNSKCNRLTSFKHNDLRYENIKTYGFRNELPATAEIYEWERKVRKEQRSATTTWTFRVFSLIYIAELEGWLCGCKNSIII